MHHAKRLSLATLRALTPAALALPALAQSPDLRVVTVDDSSVSGNWQSLKLSGALAITLENSGGSAAGGAFDVVAYSDENANSVYDSGVDKVLGATSLPDLAAGAQQLVALPIGGKARFRGDRIFVVLDTGNTIAEADEGNNQRDTGEECQVSAPPGSVNPVIQWAWTASGVDPASLNVMCTPAVIDVDGDAIPDVVFGSTASLGGGLVEVGILRALSGANGAEIWNVTDPLLAVNTAFNPAAGDIDGDGLPEIITSDASGLQLICFENDGTFKWRSPVLEPLEWGCVSLADFDADGIPEIVVGRQMLDNNGNLLWTGTGGSANPQSGALSLVCDIDLDGVPDIVAGNTVYEANGAIKCDNVGLNDGYNAVANFDADPYPEIVHVSQGEIRLLEQDPSSPGSLITVWGPMALVGGGSGGPPTVADMDGDGLPEIGVACAASYDVYEHDGTLKWSSPTFDSSSMVTGSTVFDFNGDGSAEVVYRDQTFLRVYEGATGAVIFQLPMSSCTWHEYVLVADVDADGNAEIVACANQNCSFGPQQGIYVFRDLNDDWVPTRRIWNQYNYHITNVDESGAIPLVENDNWLFPAALPFNNYRQNTLSTSLPNGAPDLTASRIVVTPSVAPDTLVARIGNGGSAFVGAGIPASFYDGAPGGGGVLLGTVSTTTALDPGEFEDVALYVGTIPSTVFVVADDTGTGAGIENECDETNNQHSVAIDLTAPSTYCESKHNSLGCLPAIGFLGNSSAAAATGFTIRTVNVLNNKPGLFIYSNTGGVSVPFFGGRRCVNTPVRRSVPMSSGGNPPPNDCSGVYSMDWNAFSCGDLGGSPQPYLGIPGTAIVVQAWGRDNGFPAGQNATLSNGLSYVVGP